jgi:hypothetical protein
VALDLFVEEGELGQGVLRTAITPFVELEGEGQGVVNGIHHVILIPSSG